MTDEQFTGIKEQQPKEKAWPNWTPIGNPYLGTYDAFNSKREPNKAELVRAFDDIAYACASLIAQTVATTPIKLFVKTDQGQARPKCQTRPVGRKTFAALTRAKNLSRGTLVEEVTAHPALELLNKCNAYHNRMDLLELTELSLEVTGNAYWLLKFDPYGLPGEVYLLPSQDMEPIRDRDLIIRGWKFGQGEGQVDYKPDEIIHFKMPSLLDPYGEGMPPLRAAWQRVMIGMKELGYIDSTLENQGRPDVVISPNEPISVFEAERLAKDWTQRYRGSGGGGPFVADGPLTVTPLNYAPRDMWELAVYKEIKTAVCNCFHVPPDLLEIGEANRATAEAALYALAVHCIKPRMARLVHKLNERLLSYYGEDRLFFEAEEVVPDDKTFELQETQVLLQTGCVTRDEVRQKYGYEPTEWAAEPLLPPGALPALAPVQEEGFEEEAPLPVDRSAQAPAIAQLQQSYYAGQLPREACIANARLLFGFGPEEAEALFPAVQPVKLTPDEHDQAGEQQAPAPELPAKAARRKALNVPDCRQSYPYDCGAAATQSVCEFFGVGPETEEEYIQALGTTADAGTSPEQIVSYLGAVGLVAEAQDDLEIPDLKKFTSAGRPVLCCIQDYEDRPEDIPEERSGHWVVVCGADDDAVTLQDPVAGRVEMPALEFLARWQDTDGKAGKADYVHFGIAVSRPGSKAKRTKAVRRKSPLTFAEALQKFFRKQAHAVAEKAKALDDLDVKTKAVPSDWFDLDHWTGAMFDAMRPIVSIYYDYSAKETVSRIGGSPSLFNVVQPKLREGVDKATLLFCKETNETTSLELSEALDLLKKELTEGLVQGDVKQAMMKRVQSVFDQAENLRAWRIAVTEASRAQHAAQEITAIESGVVKGKRWVLSDDACPQCKPLANKVVPLGENFATVEGNPAYSAIPYPPLHPHCRCDMIEVVEGVND